MAAAQSSVMFASPVIKSGQRPFPSVKATSVCDDSIGFTVCKSLMNIVACARTTENLVKTSKDMGTMQIYICVKSVTPSTKTSYTLLWDSIGEKGDTRHEYGFWRSDPPLLPPKPDPSMVLSNRHPQLSEHLPAVPGNASREHIGIERSSIFIQARLASQVCHHLLAGSRYFSRNGVSSADWPAAYGILPHNHVKSVP